MASKWLPPLKVPLDKSDAGHYLYRSQSTILHNILSRKATKSINNAIEELFGAKVKEKWADLSDRKSTYNRLFARRKNKYLYRHTLHNFKKRVSSRRILKKIKFRWGTETINYFLIDSVSKVVKPYKTKKEGLRDLAKDSIKVKKYGSWKIIKIVPGMRLVRMPAYPVDVFDVNREKFNQFPTVQVKRCDSCPNTTSNRGACHCQFWSVIRGDNVNKVSWLSSHEWIMRHHRLKKKEQKTIKIKMAFSDLFD